MDPSAELMLGTASPGTGKSGKNKSLFSFGKKKKRKPVCTCHLGYGNELAGQESIGSRLYGMDGNQSCSNSYSNSPYLGVDYSAVQHNSNGDLSKQQQQQNSQNSQYYSRYPGNQQPGSPSAHPSSPRNPSYGSSITQQHNQSHQHHHQQQHHHSQPGTPHHQNLNQYLDQSGRVQQGNFVGCYGYGNGTTGCQDFSNPLVQSMTNLNLGTSTGTPSPWDQSNAQLYQLEQSMTSSSARYRKMLISGSSFGDQTVKQDQTQYPGSYPDPYGYPQKYITDHNGYQSRDPTALVPYGNSNRQRRWSDGNNTRFSKTEADSYREEQLLKNQNYLPNSNYIPICECGNCRARNGGKPRPKVSFGPSMMYPMSDVGPYDPNLPDPNKDKKPWSHLTTELLPLDTQIPLQMMSDSALVCNII